MPTTAHAEVRELAARVRERPEDAEGARRLLYEIVRNPVLRAMLCVRDGALALGELVAPGRATVISGEAARVGEATARYLLATYLALLWSELLARERPTKTFVLLDEAQWFAHESLGEMLRLGRGRNVHLGLATQSLASLAPELQDAVRTNVADLVAFRGSPADAREIARAVGGFSADPLGGLGRGEALALVGKGEVAVRLRTARLPARAVAPGAPFPDGEPRPPTAVEASAEEEPGLPGGAETGGEGLWAELLGRAGRVPAGDLLEVDVAALRGAGRLSEEALRALGGWLGRTGALVRSERRAGGPVWWIDPGAVRARGLSGPATAVHQKRL